jgi:hypothetical protein
MKYDPSWTFPKKSLELMVYKRKCPSSCYIYTLKGLSIYSIIKGQPILFLIFFVQIKVRNSSKRS